MRKWLTDKAIIKSSKRSLEYIYFACLGVCLFVSNRRQKRHKRSGPNFVWDLSWPRECL